MARGNFTNKKGGGPPTPTARAARARNEKFDTKQGSAAKRSPSRPPQRTRATRPKK